MRTAFRLGDRAGGAAALLLLLGSVGVGCASSSPASTPSSSPQFPEKTASHLAMWTGGTHTFTATVENDDIVGSGISLHRASSESPDSTEFSEGLGFQGTAYDRPVNVTFTGSSASGVFDGGPVNLKVVEAAKGIMHIEGIVGGSQTSFEVGANRLSGYVGRCTYDMRRSSGPFHYSGIRSCGRGSQRTRIEITKPILDWAPIDVATLLSLVLNR